MGIITQAETRAKTQTQTQKGSHIHPRCRKFGTRAFKRLLLSADLLTEASDLLAARGELLAAMYMLDEAAACRDRANFVMDQWARERGLK